MKGQNESPKSALYLDPAFLNPQNGIASTLMYSYTNYGYL